MKIIKWWYGTMSFGFAIYTWPWLDRNPVIAFAKARGWALTIGRWTFQRQPKP